MKPRNTQAPRSEHTQGPSTLPLWDVLRSGWDMQTRTRSEFLWCGTVRADTTRQAEDRACLKYSRGSGDNFRVTLRQGGHP